MKKSNVRTALALALLVIAVLPLAARVWAQEDDEPNVGELKIYSLLHPRQAAPSAQVLLTIDVEYGIRTNATIKASVFEGPPANLGKELWQSDQELVSSGGDRIWNVTLTAPPTEGLWKLTVFAYYLDAGKWRYYPANDTFRGPGVSEMDIKVAPVSNLQVIVGASDVPVAIDGDTEKTGADGSVTVQLPVGKFYQISLQPIVSTSESTRLVFAGWHDGTNSSQRRVLLDGDTQIVGLYKQQYLLKVNSPISEYANSTWYNPGDTVPLSVEPVVPASGVLGALGLHYVFSGWSGDLQSSADAINVTMDQPKVINAAFSLDYTPIVIPAILLAGIVGAFFIVMLRLRRRGTAAPETAAPSTEGEGVEGKPASKFCDGCGEPVDEGWEHCTHCGRDLRPAKPVEK